MVQFDKDFEGVACGFDIAGLDLHVAHAHNLR